MFIRAAESGKSLLKQIEGMPMKIDGRRPSSELTRSLGRVPKAKIQDATLSRILDLCQRCFGAHSTSGSIA